MPKAPDITIHDATPLAGKTILVTGGAQGIGRGIARAILGAGGHVCIGDIDAEAGKACIHEWQVGPRAHFMLVDVARETSVRRWVSAAHKRFDRIDGLVNNAGIADPHAAQLGELSLTD